MKIWYKIITFIAPIEKGEIRIEAENQEKISVVKYEKGLNLESGKPLGTIEFVDVAFDGESNDNLKDFWKKVAEILKESNEQRKVKLTIDIAEFINPNEDWKFDVTYSVIVN